MATSVLDRVYKEMNFEKNLKLLSQSNKSGKKVEPNREKLH